MVHEHQIALIQLHSPLTNRLIWMPPGGGVKVGESLTDCVKREIQEECGLQVEVHNLMYVTELILPKAHVLEFYFRCEYLSGTLSLGEDPERAKAILRQAQWLPLEQISMQQNLHPAFLRERLIGDLASQNQAPFFFKTADSIHQ